MTEDLAIAVLECKLAQVEAQCAALQQENEELREQRITANCLRQEAEVTLMACEATSQKRLDDLHAEREAWQALQTALRHSSEVEIDPDGVGNRHPAVVLSKVREIARAALHASEGATK